VDKYGPAALEISEALARLQLPDLQQPPSTSSTVFLPKRRPGTSQHELFLLIREGSRAAKELVSAIALYHRWFSWRSDVYQC